MIVLGIDTSCDDTSVAVYDAKKSLVLSNVVSSQHKFHEDYGGVVPEIAARKHVEMIDVVFNEAVRIAGMSVKDIDLVCVTNAPGLLPALIVGLSFGRAMAFALGVPFKSVHHIEAHIFSPFIGKRMEFPFLSLVISGGHTQIVLVEGIGRYRTLGKTLDDAVGESYDKVARMLGLGYPGGPVIDRIYSEFEGEFLKLPKPKVEGLNFSFSGLKTAVRFLIKDGYPSGQIAASFQKTAVDYLVEKTIDAVKLTGVSILTVSGGVSANSYLRKRLKELSDSEGIKLVLPEMEFTSDNGAMVAYCGYLNYLYSGGDDFEVNAHARKPIG